MNICKAEFGTKIFCSHPGSEYKEINNLLCENGRLEVGYLALSYVKPPVYILVSWSEWYKANKITFKPSFGRHVVNKMSIKCICKRELSETINENNFKSIIDQFKGRKSDIFINQSSKECENIEINLLSKFQNSNNDLFIFNLIRENVICILFEIVAMKNTSIPCLSNLKIFADIEKKIKIITRNIDNKKNKECNNEISHVEETNITYPDDCLDPLTAEILYNPVKLPCGKYVNRETLEKCWQYKCEDIPKMNPFTRVPLTSEQLELLKLVDMEKKNEIVIKIKEIQEKRQHFYNSITNPQKKCIKRDRPYSDSDSDEEYQLQKLEANIDKNFHFLFKRKK